MAILNNDAKRFIECLPVLTGQEFSPWGPFVHAWDESAGFTRVIGKNNFWGIKLPTKSKWVGEVVERPTHEYMEIIPNEKEDEALNRAKKKWGRNDISIESIRFGKWYLAMPQKFIDWATTEQAFLWYSDLICRLYPDSWSNRGIPAHFFWGLNSGENKYNGNPRYFEDLMAYYDVLQNNEEVKESISKNMFS